MLARYVNSRVTVNAGQPVLRIADTSLMSIDLELPDRLISRFTPGKEVPVEVSALEGMPPFRGRVSEVGVAANAQGRLYRVVIKVPNPDGLLRSGMTARIPVDGFHRWLRARFAFRSPRWLRWLLAAHRKQGASSSWQCSWPRRVRRHAAR